MNKFNSLLLLLSRQPPDSLLEHGHQETQIGSKIVNVPAPSAEKTIDHNPFNNNSIFEEPQRHRALAFGDYADPSFSCPAITTCPIVCVAAVDDCPADALCPGTHPDNNGNDDHEYELCLDGTCADLTLGEACDAEATSPCECDARPVICAKQVDYFDSCKERFQGEYDDNAACIEAQEQALPQVDFTGPWFMACYIGISLVTVWMLLWCAYNQRWSPVPGSVATLESAKTTVGGGSFTVAGAKRRAAAKDGEQLKASANDEGSDTNSYALIDDAQPNEDDEEEGSSAQRAAKTNARTTSDGWTQTGYKSTIVGMFLYGLVILTHLIIQFLLLFLTIHYYVQQEAITSLGNPIFYDEIQVLMAFEIVWMVGFVWCFFLKYPTSIHSLFLRRCHHNEATYIAVSAPVQTMDTQYENKTFVKVLMVLGKTFRKVLSFIYSDKTQNPGNGTQHKVTVCQVLTDPKTGSKYFYFRMRRYIYSNDTNTYIPGCWDVTSSNEANIGSWLDTSYLHRGLSNEEATTRLGIVGPNVLDLKKPTPLGSIHQEFSKAFYLYQNFMVWTWMPFWYYYMGLVNTVVRVTGGLVVAFFQYGSDLDLYRLMVMEGTADVLREGTFVTMDQTDVVPGDIIRLSPGMAHFDMCLLQSSTNVLVDESALTGEVHPISKVPMDPANSHLIYNPKTYKSSTLSAGTTILECGTGGEEKEPGITENCDLAIVTQTGSFTAKGELLCDVLSYERHKFKFDTEVQLILAILCVEAAIMLAVVFSVINDAWVYSWFYAMFVVGTVLPPLLPTVFVVSVGISCKRLQKRRITCTDSRGILVAGKVKKAFFDKTGTLTKQGLEFVSALTGDELGNLRSAKPTDGDNDDEEDDDIRASYMSNKSEQMDFMLQRGLATCHTLSLSAEGELIGAAVDRMGFTAVPSGAELMNHGTSVKFQGKEITYLKRFEFDHHRMTQSVIIRQGEDTPFVYVKGSPEAIRRLCNASSLPAEFDAKARQSARDGIYQLAMASAPFTNSENKSMNEVTRDDIEKHLTFAGFINFQNTMKEDTPAVIRGLREGNVDAAMITGDNVLTGIYIAKKAGLIAYPNKPVIIANSVLEGTMDIEWVDASDDTVVTSASRLPDPATLDEFTQTTALAMTGEVWNHLLTYDPKSALEYAKYTTVFGRTTPNDKVSIVSTFVEMGEITLMCGDGGNDCGALKAAHVGIALSDAEASVVAPFTSLDKTITSVTEVLREGRCALASALAAYKYMIMYGQVESINQVANAYLSITFTEWCWVFMDGIWTITMAFSLPLARAAKTLSPKRPTASLLGPHTLLSACGILAINFLFLVIALLTLWGQDWFQCRMWDSEDVSNILAIGDNYETSVIFIVTGYQYISSAAAYNFGYCYRANWFRNYVFVFFFALWTAFHFAATLTASSFSCIWRLNCDNDHVVRWVTSTTPEPIFNVFNTTVMPMSFRVVLLVLMIVNLILNCSWDYFIVNMALPKIGAKMGWTTEDTSQHSNVKRAQLSAPVDKQMDLA